MKVIILAAGYGTRLQKDIIDNATYNHLRGLPKPLVPLNSKPLINYWLTTLDQYLSSTNQIHFPNDVYIVTNDFFHEQVMQWCERYQFPKKNVLNDGTKTNEDRLGAVADIQLAINQYSLYSDDLMIIGGDTLFTKEFHTTQIRYILEQNFGGNQTQPKQPVILYYDLEDHVNISEKGILEVKEIDERKALVTDFKEKPQPHETNSRLACPCFYILDKDSVSLIGTFLEQSREDRKQTDATGNLVKFLSQQRQTIAYKIDQRFDVGHLQEYLFADNYFVNHGF